MNRLQHYIFREVLKPLLVITLILAGLFACFSGARYMSQAVTETIGAAMIIKLIALKTIIALEVLFPIALYAAVIVALGRLYRDQEIVVLHSIGIGEPYIIRAIFMFALPIAVIVGIQSTTIRPWAYDQIYKMDSGENSELNMDRYQSGRFYGSESSGRIIYIGDKSSNDDIENIFHYIRGENYSDIIIASQAYNQQPDQNKPPQIHLEEGVMYRLYHDRKNDTVVDFKKFIHLPEVNNANDYRRKAAETTELLYSEDSRDVAEAQWRISRPLATMILALIAIPLSRASPRQGKSEKIFTAAIVFAIYYNLNGLAQTWLEIGVVQSMPGVWWLHSLMLIIVLTILYSRRNH